MVKNVFLAATALFAIIPAQAMADTGVMRSSTRPITFSGVVTANVGGISQTCNISVVVNHTPGTDAHTFPAGSPVTAPAWTGVDNSHSDFALTAGSTVFQVTGFTLSGGTLGLCAAASLNGLPYNVQYVSGPSGSLNATSWGIKIVGVNANNFATGQCGGDITATWVNNASIPGNPTISLNPATLPGIGGGSSCSFGAATLTANRPARLDKVP